MTNADLLASVTDAEIEALLKEKESTERRVNLLQNELADALSDLAEIDAAIAEWLREVRDELESRHANTHVGARC